MRISASVLVMRLINSLAAALPGTAAFDLSRSSRVSNETPPLYCAVGVALRALRLEDRDDFVREVDLLVRLLGQKSIHDDAESEKCEQIAHEDSAG